MPQKYSGHLTYQVIQDKANPQRIFLVKEGEELDKELDSLTDEEFETKYLVIGEILVNEKGEAGTVGF